MCNLKFLSTERAMQQAQQYFICWMRSVSHCTDCTERVRSHTHAMPANRQPSQAYKTPWISLQRHQMHQLHPPSIDKTGQNNKTSSPRSASSKEGSSCLQHQHKEQQQEHLQWQKPMRRLPSRRLVPQAVTLWSLQDLQTVSWGLSKPH